MFRDLVGMVQRENAAMGISLSLKEPTWPMVTEAASTGQSEIDGLEVPKVQIVTIEEALRLRDRPVQLPLRRDDAFGKAAREQDKRAGQPRLRLERVQKKPESGNALQVIVFSHFGRFAPALGCGRKTGARSC